MVHMLRNRPSKIGQTGFIRYGVVAEGLSWNMAFRQVIVEEEQQGKGRAEYGKALVEELSRRLTADYGKGFSPSTLWYMVQFYRAFRILHTSRGESAIPQKSAALRSELFWIHYRLLLKVKDEKPLLWLDHTSSQWNGPAIHL